MEKNLRMGVIGAGVFGGYHANKCATHDRVHFVGVFDTDYARAQILAAKHDVTAFKSYADFLNDIDAVIIATPASSHGEMAIKALNGGCHVLVEKPIADTVALGHRIVDLAQVKHCVLQVGHQERFVLKAIGLDKIEERPSKIIGHRRSPYSDRGTDVSVTLDLMTHDLDLVLWLMQTDPTSISGQSHRVRSETPDTAHAFLQFDGGEARLEASRVATKGSRVMELTYESGTVTIDFNAKTLVNSSKYDLNGAFGEDPSARDSLGAATNAFVEAILDGKPVPITGGNGLRALNAALIVDHTE